MRLTDFAIEKEGVFKIEVREITSGDEAVFEGDLQKGGIAFSKIDAYEFAIEKVGVLEAATVELSEAKVTMLKGTVDKVSFK